MNIISNIFQSSRIRIIISFFIIFLLPCCTKEKVITKMMADKGEQLFNSVGCTKCHSLTGDAMYGPTLKFVPGQSVTVVRKGSLKNVELDRKYILRSMKDPEYEKLSGFQEKKMAKIELSDDAIESIADYLIYANTEKK